MVRILTLVSFLSFDIYASTSIPDLYNCVTQLAEVRGDRSQFYWDGGLVMTSVLGGDGVSLFVVSEVGLYGYRIASGRPLKLHLTLSTPEKKSEDYFFEYFHSDIFGRTVRNFSIGLPVKTSSPSNYSTPMRLKISRGQLVKQYLRFVTEGLDEVIQLNRSGSVSSVDLRKGKLERCRDLSQSSEGLMINARVQELEILPAPPSRMPASYQ